MKRTITITDLKAIYSKWTESELRNGIWHLSNGRSIPGGYTDIELLRAELRHRGLTDEGYHNT